MLICTSITFSQDQINPNGYNILYYPNGKKLSEGYIKNGKPEGYWKTYYTTGILKSEGNRKNFLLDSVWIFYNSTGDTIKKINYLIGKKNGYYYEYNTERTRPEYIGSVLSKELYINDIKEGLSYYYYKDGKIREEINYTRNKKNGISIDYAKDRRIKTIKRYSKGSLVERQRINRYTDNNEKTGIWKEFYEGLKVKKEINYKGGVLNGYYKEYNKQGKLTLTLFYQDGKLVEEVKEEEKDIVVIEKLDEEGNLVERGPYINDITVGIHKTYNRDGDIIKSRIYNDNGKLLSLGIIDKEGKKEGEWINYYTSGEIRAKGNNKNNQREGKWLFYFENGKIEQEGNYRKGKENGLWKWYYDSGEIFIEEEFYNGKEEGIYSEYNKFGNVISEGEYFDGEKEGEWIVTINDFVAKGKYITGLRDDKWKYFYSGGILMFEGEYIQGNAEGKHKYYYPNASIKEEQFYNSGIPNKHWKKYDEEGHIIVTISYQDGKEYRINGVKIDFPDDNKVIIK
ncbi:hypothetical protein ES705_10874 [subsurface metagenome]